MNNISFNLQPTVKPIPLVCSQDQSKLQKLSNQVILQNNSFLHLWKWRGDIAAEVTSEEGFRLIFPFEVRKRCGN